MRKGVRSQAYFRVKSKIFFEKCDHCGFMHRRLLASSGSGLERSIDAGFVLIPKPEMRSEICGIVVKFNTSFDEISICSYVSVSIRTHGVEPGITLGARFGRVFCEVYTGVLLCAERASECIWCVFLSTLKDSEVMKLSFHHLFRPSLPKALTKRDCLSVRFAMF